MSDTKKDPSQGTQEFSNNSDRSFGEQGLNSEPENNSLESKYQEALAQADKWKADFLYLRAEFDTFKRNSIRERSELIKFGPERFATELLGIIDNFDRAMEVSSVEQFENLKKGLQMTQSEIRSLLQKFQIQEIPCQGAKFDPSLHEALGQEPTDQTPEGHVHRVFRKPYKMHEKLIRSGQVLVAVKKPASN